MPLQVSILPVTGLRQNCSLIWCGQSMKGAIIDPGGDVGEIESAIRETGMTPELILITHAHVDHAGGARVLAEKLSIPIKGPHIDDEFLTVHMEMQGAMFDLPDCSNFTPDEWLGDGDSIALGDVTLDVIHCPGHTPGHVVFFDRETSVAFVGDVIFRGSIGRTDFPRGNHSDLVASIKQKLFPLGDGVSFVPGHGPMSTFGEEKKSNPYVGENAG